MSKWTPGPWYAYQRKTNGRWEIARYPMDYFSRDVHDGRYIADLRGPDWPGVPQGETIDANARLIAAAPEMAELLRRYLDTADKPAAQAKLADIDAEARALLARVEGE